MTEGRWEHFVHGADIGVRGVAPTLSGAFEQGALALIGVITDPAEVAPTASVEVQCHRPAVEVKGATYTQLTFRQEPDGQWLAQFDKVGDLLENQAVSPLRTRADPNTARCISGACPRGRAALARPIPRQSSPTEGLSLSLVVFRKSRSWLAVPTRPRRRSSRPGIDCGHPIYFCIPVGQPMADTVSDIRNRGCLQRRWRLFR